MFENELNCNNSITYKVITAQNHVNHIYECNFL